MYATVKTIYNTQLELLEALKEPFQPMDYSTLNEKFNIEANTTLPIGLYPELKYIAIGRGGHRGRITTDGLTIIDVLQHNIVHASLYEHIPFILREVTNDLSAAERSGYGMRVLVEKDGVNYFAYYLKRIDLSTTYPTTDELTVANGETTSIPYIPVPAQLNPTPIPYSNSVANASTGKHISVSSTLELNLSEVDIAEIIAAVETIYGDVGYAVISEVATVSAIIDTVNTTLGGVNISYDEALAAQIMTHVPTNVALQFTTRSINHRYDIGFTSVYTR